MLLRQVPRPSLLLGGRDGQLRPLQGSQHRLRQQNHPSRRADGLPPEGRVMRRCQ